MNLTFYGIWEVSIELVRMIDVKLPTEFVLSQASWMLLCWPNRAADICAFYNILSSFACRLIVQTNRIFV